MSWTEDELTTLPVAHARSRITTRALLRTCATLDSTPRFVSEVPTFTTVVELAPGAGYTLTPSFSLTRPLPGWAPRLG
jgi:hypothetical protein